MPWTCLVRSANARTGPDRAAYTDRPCLGRLLQRPARRRDREEQIAIGGPASGKLPPLAVGNRPRNLGAIRTPAWVRIRSPLPVAVKARRVYVLPPLIACGITAPLGRCCSSCRGCGARRLATRVRDGRGAARAHGGPGPWFGVRRLAGSGGARGGAKPGPRSNRLLGASCSPDCGLSSCLPSARSCQGGNSQT